MLARFGFIVRYRTRIGSSRSTIQCQERQPYERGAATTYQLAEALLAGAWVSEGLSSPSRAGSDSVDAEFFTEVLNAYDLVVGGARYVTVRAVVD